MKITINPSYSEIYADVSLDSVSFTKYINTIKKLTEIFVIKQEKYKKQFGRKEKGGKFVTEIVDLLEYTDNYSYRFLTGFLHEIIDKLSEFGYEERYSNLILDYTYNTLPEVVPFKINTLNESPRDYQIDGIIKALSLGRAVIKGSVGAGKTLMMSLLLSALRNYKTLIIVPSLDLMKQIQSELVRLIPNYSVCQIDYKKIDMSCNAFIGLPIHFRNISDEFLQQMQVLCMDEVHTSPATIAKDTILRQNAPYRFGFTATTKGRSDGMDKIINGLFGEEIEVISYQETVEQNFTPKIDIEMYYSGWDDNYLLMEEMLIINNKKRNDLIAKIATEHLKQNKNGIVFILAKRIDHIVKLYENYFPDAIVLTGEVDNRSDIIKDIKDGLYKIVLASNVLSQGISIPQFTLGINASGGKSSILTEQRAGRMARGDTDIVKKWVDIYDNYTPTFDRHSLARTQVYNKVYGNVKLINFPDSKLNKVKYSLYTDPID